MAVDALEPSALVPKRRRRRRRRCSVRAQIHLVTRRNRSNRCVRIVLPWISAS